MLNSVKIFHEIKTEIYSMEFHQPRAIDGIERKTEDKEAVRGNIYEMIQQLRTGSSTDLTDGHGRWVPGQDARR